MPTAVAPRNRLSDTDAEKVSLITAFAQSVGAAVEDVTLTVEAASVKLTFEVVTKSEVAKAPPAVIDVSLSASQPTVQKIYAPVTYP